MPTNPVMLYFCYAIIIVMNNEGALHSRKEESAPSDQIRGDPAMSERITSTGKLSYRTRLLTQEKAEQFARCLRSNPLFAEVAVVESTRSQGRYFVDFLPSSTDRQEAMLDRQQQQRSDRATTQQFTFCLDK